MRTWAKVVCVRGDLRTHSKAAGTVARRERGAARGLTSRSLLWALGAQPIRDPLRTHSREPRATKPPWEAGALAPPLLLPVGSTSPLRQLAKQQARVEKKGTQAEWEASGRLSTGWK